MELYARHQLKFCKGSALQGEWEPGTPFRVAAFDLHMTEVLSPEAVRVSVPTDRLLDVFAFRRPDAVLPEDR